MVVVGPALLKLFVFLLTAAESVSVTLNQLVFCPCKLN